MRFRGRRVAVVNWRDLDHSLAGGSEKYAWECALAFGEEGADVEFLTARDAGQPSRSVREGITIIRAGGRFTFYPWVLAILLWHRLRKPYDLVVDAEHGIPVFAPLVVGRRTAVLLVIHHVHLDQFLTYFPRPLAQLGRWLEGWVMPRVYRRVRTLAVSESTHEEMVDQLGWTGPVEIVRNGTVEPVLTAGLAPPGPSSVVVLGRLATHKRVNLVIRAVEALRPARPDITLDIVGSGPDESMLRELADQLGLAGVVRFHGHVSDREKYALLQQARLHVSASDIEGWGQVVIEAASVGVPTLARDVPGLRESIRSGHTGWLVDEPDSGLRGVAARLATHIEQALVELEDDSRRTTIWRACRTWATQFTWSEMHHQLRTIAAEELGCTSEEQRRYEGLAS